MNIYVVAVTTAAMFVQHFPSKVEKFYLKYKEMEKEMATHSSVLAWRIPGMGEPGGLPSMGSNRVGRD